MKFITDINQIAGKTIKDAKFIDDNESVALTFTDDTCAVFDVEFYGGYSHDINLIDNLDDHLSHDCWIITEE